MGFTLSLSVEMPNVSAGSWSASRKRAGLSIRQALTIFASFIAASRRRSHSTYSGAFGQIGAPLVRLSPWIGVTGADHVQRRQNLCDDFVRRRLDRDNDWIFVWSRFFQRLELTVKQAFRHEMLMTGSDAACDQLLIALEIDQTDVGAIANQDIAVATFQSRACDNAGCGRSKQRPFAARNNDPRR